MFLCDSNTRNPQNILIYFSFLKPQQDCCCRCHTCEIWRGCTGFCSVLIGRLTLCTVVQGVSKKCYKSTLTGFRKNLEFLKLCALETPFKNVCQMCLGILVRDSSVKQILCLLGFFKTKLHSLDKFCPNLTFSPSFFHNSRRWRRR